MSRTADANKGLRSKMPQILHKLGVKADIISLKIGPILYFTGKYTWIYYPYKSIVCILAFSYYKDLQVLNSNEVPDL